MCLLAIYNIIWYAGLDEDVLFMRTTELIMFYASQLETDALQCDKHLRKASTCLCSYRTISESTVLVVSRIIPIYLLVQERYCHCKKPRLAKR